MEFSKDDLREAKRQIDSTLHKLRARETADRCKPQITLAVRRVKAFEIADRLIERELNNLEE